MFNSLSIFLNLGAFKKYLKLLNFIFYQISGKGRIKMQIQNKIFSPIVNNQTSLPVKKSKEINVKDLMDNPDVYTSATQKTYTSGVDDVKTLHSLAAEYIKDKNIDNKHKLLQQEEKILLQELTEPEKYLERAKRMGAMENPPKNQEDQIKQLQINALYGLLSHCNALKNLNLPQNNGEIIIPAIEKILKETPDDSELNKRLKLYALYPLSNIYKHLKPELKERTDNILLDVLKNSASEDSRKRAFAILSNKINKDKPFYKTIQELSYKQWTDKKGDLSQKRTALINLGQVRSPKLTTIIPKILTNKATDHKLKMAAIWCAGRVKTEENFKLLSNIVNSEIPSKSDEKIKDEELKEMALSSIALYVKKHPEEVRQIMEKVSKSDSALKDNAAVLWKKVQGKGYVKDDIINQKLFDEIEREQYKKLRAQYIQGVDKLNTKQKNRIDQGILPFMNILKKLVGMEADVSILDDTITGKMIWLAGDRSGDGRFVDTVDGVNSGRSIVISKWNLNRPDNVSAHEFNHAFLANVMAEDDKEKLTSLYENAKKENRLLDYYAARNRAEYFAQGYESYVKNYKSQNIMVDNGDYYRADSTKVHLKHKDPDLYNFIEYCIKKYSISKDSTNSVSVKS